MTKFNFGNAFKEFLDDKLTQELDDVKKLFFDADGMLKNGNTMEGFTQWTYGIRKEHAGALKNPEKLSALRKEFISSKLKNSNKNLRPTATINGNNVEIDSIYNHSIPKRVNKNNAPQPETSAPERNTRRPLTAEEQDAVDRANAQWKADNEARYADMDKQIENMYKADDIVFGTPEQILDPNYVSSFDPLEETIESTMDAAEETINQASKSTPHRRTGRQTGRYAKQRNVEKQSTKNRGRSGNAKGKTGPTKSIDELHQEANQRKWANEQYAKQQAEQLNKYKQTYEDILDDWKKHLVTLVET